MQREVGERLAASVEVSRRESRYQDPNRLEDGLLVRREDVLSRLVLGLSKRLDRRWQLEAGYEYADNQSNLVDYTYRQNIYRIGTSAFF